MLKFINNLIYKFKIKRINKKLLEDQNTRRKYLRKILKFIRVNDLLPSTVNKYIKIEPFFNSIKEYNFFMTENFLNYDFTNPMPRSLMNLNSRKIYYIDFFVYKNRKVNEYEELEYYLTLYMELVDLIPYYDITTNGYMFLNFKILDYYLTNMEDILIKIISSKLS